MYCFFFNDTATTEIYTLSLHDALPIFVDGEELPVDELCLADAAHPGAGVLQAEHQGPPQLALAALELLERDPLRGRSEEHTSELQSRQYLVCRLLLEKKQNTLLLRCTS